VNQFSLWLITYCYVWLDNILYTVAFDTERFSTPQLRPFTRFAFSWGIWIMYRPLDWGRSCASALRGWCQGR